MLTMRERAGKLRASGHAFAGCGVGIDHGASDTLERLDLLKDKAAMEGV